MFKNKIAIFIGVVVIIIIGIVISSDSQENNGGAENVVMEQSFDEVVINKSEITSVAQFYPVLVDDVEMEVMAVRASDGTVRTSLNACVVCGSSGRGYYVQEGDEFVCQNCGNRYKIDQIETERGGCNPAPIMSGEKIEDDETIIIPKETLIENKDIYLYSF